MHNVSASSGHVITNGLNSPAIKIEFDDKTGICCDDILTGEMLTASPESIKGMITINRNSVVFIDNFLVCSPSLLYVIKKVLNIDLNNLLTQKKKKYLVLCF